MLKDYPAHVYLKYFRQKLNQKLVRRGLFPVSASNPRTVPRTVVVPRRLQVVRVPSKLRFLAYSAPVPRLMKEIETNLGPYWSLASERRRR